MAVSEMALKAEQRVGEGGPPPGDSHAAGAVVRSPLPADRAESVLRGVVATVSVVGLSWVALPLTYQQSPEPLAWSLASAMAATVPPVVVRRRHRLTGGGLALALPGQRSLALPAYAPVAGSGRDPEARALNPAALPPLCRFLKRSVDVVVATVALMLALPVLLAASLAIVAESRGGVLFTQTRVGAGGHPFRLFKLRTMRAGNDDGEHRAYVAALICGQGQSQEGMFKIADDDRRTRVGRVLRSFSIDELPQLWNVLRGEMSVVGPRPSLPEEVALFDANARGRMAAKPGLTGLWQVSGRSRLSFEEMVDLDLRYWREWSPLLDMRILLRTPKAVLWNRDTA